MRTLVLLAALLIPGLAAAQVGAPVLTADFGGQNTYVLTKDGCANQISVNWSETGVSAAGVCSPGLQLWITTASACQTAGPATGDLVVGTVSAGTFVTQNTGTFTISAAQLPAFVAGTSTGDGGTTGAVTCGSATQVTMNLCARLPYLTSPYNGCTSASDATASVASTISYDALPPSPPTISNIEARDSALNVTVSVDADTFIAHVRYRVAGTTDDFGPGVDIQTDTTTSGTITGLTNGVTYELEAYATDQADNASASSGPSTGTPLHTEGFFDRYKRLGGEESGGCSAAGGGLLAWALIVTGRVLSRRRR